MASVNRKRINQDGKTHEGAIARRITPAQELERSVLTCLLWEKEFYESGESIADRIAKLVKIVDPEIVADIARRSRLDMKIRHVGLFLIRELVRRPEGRKYAEVLTEICQRPDDITEFMSIYWKDGKQPIAAAVKRALGATFQNFSEYQLAKYNRTSKEVTLRDVLFMTHGKPKTTGEGRYSAIERRLAPRMDDTLTPDEALYQRLVNDELASPETWENRLSRGENQTQVWTELMKEGKLGTLAFVRNLRNMVGANVDKSLIRDYANTANVDKILPYQFITAARMVPTYEDILEPMMFKCLEGAPKRQGKTRVLIDVSYSMYQKLSSRGDTTRADVAAGLAIIARELYEDVEVYTFSNRTVQVAPRRGFALRDAIENSQEHGSTYLGAACVLLDTPDTHRLIVLTDEQSHDRLNNVKHVKNAYMINVASSNKTVTYGSWVSITGWSEAILTYIDKLEEFRD